MKEHHPLDDLADVFQDTPDQHHLANLDKLEAHSLPLELSVGGLGLLVHQTELGVLGPLEEVEVSNKVERVVDLAGLLVYQEILMDLGLFYSKELQSLLLQLTELKKQIKKICHKKYLNIF